MKRPKWSARALYIAVALALVISFMPAMTASPVLAQALVCDFDFWPTYAMVGEDVQFTDLSYQEVTEEEPENWLWDFGDGNDSTDQNPTHSYALPGTYTITLTAYWGNASAVSAPKEIVVGRGLIPNYDWNVLSAEGYFEVPQAYAGSVQLWRFIPGLGLQGPGSDYVVDGGNINGPPQADFVRVDMAMDPGELAIVAYTNVDLDGDGVDDILIGYKKWGKITSTELRPMDYNCDFNTWATLPCGGSTTLVHYEDTIPIYDVVCLPSNGRFSDFDNPTFDNGYDKKGRFGYTWLSDMVNGTFVKDGQGLVLPHAADGAVVHWFVLDARAPVYDLPRTYQDGVSAEDLIDTLSGWLDTYEARCVEFAFGTPWPVHNGSWRHVTTESGDSGITGLTRNMLWAFCAQPVKIVTVATYPYLDGPQYPVFAQVCSWEFRAQQLEKVPQVAWAGDKVVLEKQFGIGYADVDVLFSLHNDSPGHLVPIEYADAQGAQQVVTTADSQGTARVIVESQSPGKVDVNAAIYPDGMTNQHAFVVYYLELEGITLGNVQGERVGHDEGLFEYPDGSTNPWDPEHPDLYDKPLLNDDHPAYPDEDTDPANVSQDTLLRATVKGWFELPRKTFRPAGGLDVTGDGQYDIMLPAGRWVLPDDWVLLSGGGGLSDDDWKRTRLHYDIMTQPHDDVMSLENPLGPYYHWDRTNPNEPADRGAAVAMEPVIGPYSGLDTYMPEVYDAKLDRKTIVPNSKLNKWDCPMPVAKIGFVITSGPGYFKQADKADIYYEWLWTDWPSTYEIAYTNPFYQTMVPASSYIPPLLNNGGYDWNSWGIDGPEWGPYRFWDFINTSDGITPDDPQHPTWVWVYSDNHGEAMVWLNGDWNLDLGELPHDIPFGTTVGTTNVAAVAEHPYWRGASAAYSNRVIKTWEWGVDIRGYGERLPDFDPWRMVIQVRNADNTQIDGTSGLSDRKIAFLWVSDRDGMPIEGATIHWSIAPANGAKFHATGSSTTYPSTAVPNLGIVNGFLAGTNGQTLNPERTEGVSETKLPGPAELELWRKRWGDLSGLPPAEQLACSHGVAAVLIHSPENGHVRLVATIDMGREGTITRVWNIPFTQWDPQNPCPEFRVFGDITGDGFVRIEDVAWMQQIIFGERAYTKYADLNGDGKVDLLDWILIKREYLRLNI